MNEDLLSTVEASPITKVAVQGLRKMRMDGTGPKFVKIGNRVYYRRADLERWLASRTFSSTKEAKRARDAAA